MRPFFLNRLNSSHLLKLGKSFFERHYVKKSCLHFQENCTELVKKSFFRTVVFFPNVTSPQNQFASDKKNSSLSLFNLAVNFLLVSIRIIFISTVVFGLLTFYWTTRLLGINYVFPPVLLKAIEFLGPTFIKFGQWLSTRRDIFPEEFCSTLAKLQRYTTSHSWIYTKNLLEATYGKNWKELFVKFESTTPIGSGCCAQVYKAWIDRRTVMNEKHESKVSSVIEIAEYLSLNHFLDFWNQIIQKEENFPNESFKNSELLPVAVKILHPGIEQLLERDLRVVRCICQGIEFLFPNFKWLSISDCIEEFSKIMTDQVDMELEAANLSRFSKNFSANPEIVFPNPIIKYTNRRILVESFHNGSCISDFLDCSEKDLKHKLAKIGITAILKMIFEDNFVHCDLHPGNILVEEFKSEESQVRNFFKTSKFSVFRKKDFRLVFLDCGLVTSLDEECRQNLQDVFRSVAQGDGKMAGEYMLRRNRSEVSNPEGFKKALDLIVRTHIKNRVTLQNVNVSTVVAELFSAMVRYQVKQDGTFSSVILSIAVIEGLGRSLDPGIDMIKELLPFVFC